MFVRALIASLLVVSTAVFVPQPVAAQDFGGLLKSLMNSDKDKESQPRQEQRVKEFSDEELRQKLTSEIRAFYEAAPPNSPGRTRADPQQVCLEKSMKVAQDARSIKGNSLYNWCESTKLAEKIAEEIGAARRQKEAQVKDAAETASFQACVSRNQSSASEGDVIYAEAKCDGVDERGAFLARALLPNVQEMYVALAGTQSGVAFKGLQIGAEFKAEDMPNTQGDGVSFWNGRKHVGYGICANGECFTVRDMARVRWKCSTELWSSFASCELATPGKFATAFGAKLEKLEIGLISPRLLNSLAGKDVGAVQWRIVSIELTGEDASMLQPAKEYLQSMTKKTPQGQGSQSRPLDAGLTPSKERCAAVMKKRVTDLTSVDLELKKQCNSGLTTLADLEVQQTTLKYGECCSVRVVNSNVAPPFVVMSLVGNEALAIATGEKAKARRVNAEKELQAQDAKRRGNDF